MIQVYSCVCNIYESAIVHKCQIQMIAVLELTYIESSLLHQIKYHFRETIANLDIIVFNLILGDIKLDVVLNYCCFLIILVMRFVLGTFQKYN